LWEVEERERERPPPPTKEVKRREGVERLEGVLEDRLLLLLNALEVGSLLLERLGEEEVLEDIEAEEVEETKGKG